MQFQDTRIKFKMKSQQITPNIKKNKIDKTLNRKTKINSIINFIIIDNQLINSK